MQGYDGASDRIASHYSPQLLTQEKMREKALYGKKAMVKTRGEAAPINMANVRPNFSADEEPPGSPGGPGGSYGANPLSGVGLTFGQEVKQFFADVRRMPDVRSTHTTQQ